MPKYRVSVSYDIKVFETFEVVVGEDGPHDVSSPEEKAEELAEFHESPYDFCSQSERVSKEEGDIRDGSWVEHVEEISALDRIVEVMTDCEDPHCIDGTSSDGRKDDGSKWEEGPHGDCENCNGSGKVPVPQFIKDIDASPFLELD